MAAERLTLRLGDHEFEVDLLDARAVRIGGDVLHLQADADGGIRADGLPGVAWTAVAGDTRWVFLDGEVFEFQAGERAARRRASAHHGTLSAPMPATVRRVAVSVGDAVKQGETLLVLEAMKMELPVRSPLDGVVEAVKCREGELVQPGVPLIEIRSP
jgi:3-methylcrotonyl-CoA carboxylase alpha subunit